MKALFEKLILKAVWRWRREAAALFWFFFNLFPPPGPNCWTPVSLSQNRILHNVLCCKGCSSRRGLFFVWARLICVSLVLSRETRRFIIMLFSFGPIKGFCFIFVCEWAEKNIHCIQQCGTRGTMRSPEAPGPVLMKDIKLLFIIISYSISEIKILTFRSNNNAEEIKQPFIFTI